MNKFYDAIQNPSGDILANHRVQVLDSGGSIVTIYEDANGTRFTDSNNNNVNYATTDPSNGLAKFYWTAALGQTLQIRDPADDLVLAIADFANNFSSPDAAVNVDTVLGVTAADGNLGAFTGSTIPDDSAVKPALQSLETAVETKAATTALAATDANVTAAQGDITTLQARAASLEAADTVLTAADTALDGRLDAVETLKPTGEGTALALAAALKPIPAGPRDAIQYVANNRVSFTRKTATMGGFRYKGQYQKTGRQPSFPINGNVANVSTMQAALSALKFEAWYAIFVVADDDDTQAEIKVMPYLRLAAPSGGSADIIAGGENVTDLTATASHSWTSTDNLAGTDCLVIHETKIFSGRTASITANSATSITLDDMGSLDAGDFILPAPPGYDHYCYIGSFYLDGSEVRNIADNGVGASSRAVNHSSATGSGTVTTYEEIDWRGYICPLATGIVINLTQTLNTGSTGELLQRMSIDSSNHDVWEKYETKGSAAVKRCWEPRIDLDFGQSSSTWYQNAGSLTAQTTSRQFEIRGWKEP